MSTTSPLLPIFQKVKDNFVNSDTVTLPKEEWNAILKVIINLCNQIDEANEIISGISKLKRIIDESENFKNV